MTEFFDICRVEYLMGNLATAYKGTLTSLILKDFCITETDDITTMGGTILSMPEVNIGHLLFMRILNWLGRRLYTT